MGFPLSSLRAFMPLFLSTHCCCFPLSPWWRMLGSRAGLLHFSGRRWRRNGTCILVSFFRVGRRRWRWKARCLKPTSPSLPREVMTLSRLVLILFHIRGGLPLIGNIILESSPPLSACTCSNRRSLQASLRLLLQDHSWMPLLLIGPVAVKGRHLHQPHLPLPKGEYVISKFYSFFILVIHWAFLRLTLYTCFFFSSISSLNIRRILQPLALYCLMSPSLRYTHFLCLIYACIFIFCNYHMLSLFLFLHVCLSTSLL